MELSSETKCLIIVGTVVAVVFLINYYSSQKINKALPQEYSQENALNPLEHFASMSGEASMESASMESENASVPSLDVQQLKQKFNSKNKAVGGKYKKVSYAEGERASNGEFGAYFDDNNALVKNGHLANDKFTGIDEVDGKFASYKAGSKQKMTDEDIFNADNFLPKETNKDWFEVMPEPISVKNRHLINVSRPIGVNTIGTSLRNASYDIRGSPPCPKFVVSPWLQSTIEPDYNLKGLC